MAFSSAFYQGRRMSARDAARVPAEGPCHRCKAGHQEYNTVFRFRKGNYHLDCYSEHCMEKARRQGFRNVR